MDKSESVKEKYTSRIIKASALLTDTKALLHLWDADIPVQDNLRRIRDDNLIGKPSRSRLDDVLPIFRRRYLAGPGLANALSVLVKGRLPPSSLDRILYWYALQADPLLRDFVTDYLYPRYRSGRVDLSTNEVISRLGSWRDEGRTAGPWSQETMSRVAQGLLATLRDFGLLAGAVNKHIVPPSLAVEAFAFVAFDRARAQPSGERLLADPIWEVYFLDHTAAEREFLQAHQARLLHYHAAGSVVRIDFPLVSLEDYAASLLGGPRPAEYETLAEEGHTRSWP